MFALRKRLFFHIEPELGFARGFIRAVTLEAGTAEYGLNLPLKANSVVGL